MQLTIHTSDILPTERMAKLLAGIRELFAQEGVSCEIENKVSEQLDPWDALNFEELSVDTEIEDFAENHVIIFMARPSVHEACFC